MYMYAYSMFEPDELLLSPLPTTGGEEEGEVSLDVSLTDKEEGNNCHQSSLL